MRTLIIEDDAIVANSLIELLHKLEKDIIVAATIKTVAEGINFLKKNTDIDLIFSDVHLPDGLAFEIFKEVNVNIPVIFVTAFEEFVVNAFEANGIDFILKPISGENLQEALLKYKRLSKHFYENIVALSLLDFRPRAKTRIIGKKGAENIALSLNEIVLFVTEKNITYAIDANNKKFIIDGNLSVLETELNPEMFFRANRQFIINLLFIKSYRPLRRVKLQVELTHLQKDYYIVLSQETAPLFKKWIVGR